MFKNSKLNLHISDHVCHGAPVLNYNNANIELLLASGWRLLENKQIRLLKYSLCYTAGCLHLLSACFSLGPGEDGSKGTIDGFSCWRDWRKTQGTGFKVVHRHSSAAHRPQRLLPYLVHGLRHKKVRRMLLRKHLSLWTKISYLFQTTIYVFIYKGQELILMLII